MKKKETVFGNLLVVCMEPKEKKLKQKQKLESDEKKRLFLYNGGMFLEKLIADCNGKSIPIRNFSSSQIIKATNNFDSSCLVESLQGHCQWYKGIIDDKQYLIKKFSKYEDREDVFNDIVLSARMSNHNNFLKLLGCCFEFLLAVVVFEYADLIAFSVEEHITVNGEKSIFSWSVRLKIAKEIAIAVTYLHTAFPRIIIHKNIMPKNIFLDKNWKVKLTDFRFSVSLPEGKSRMEDERFSDIITGTFGYIDPLYLSTRSLSEYTDVYSFGVCLMVFLTGRSPHAFFEEPKSDGVPRNIVKNLKYSHENDKLDEVIEPMIAKDITSGQRLQVEAFAVLALRSCEKREEDRPKMIQASC